MASTFYVDSAAAGAGTGADWANAFTTQAAAIAASTAGGGNVFYMASGHTETPGAGVAVTWTFKGTASNPDYLIVVNKAGSVPPVAADVTNGGTITTSTTGAITITGSVYIEGGATAASSALTFSCGSGANFANITVSNNATDDRIFLKNVNLVLAGTSAGSSMYIGANGTLNSNITTVGLGVKVGAVSNVIAPQMRVRMYGTYWLAGGASIQNAFDLTTTSRGCDVIIDGLDLTNCAATVNILKGGAQVNRGRFVIQNILCPASWSGLPISADITGDAFEPEIYNYGNSSVNYASYKASMYGSIAVDTTTVHTGGATDGTTAYSLKMISLATTTLPGTLSTQDQAFRCGYTSGNTTLSVEIAHSAAALLKDNEIWLEATSLDAAGNPLGTRHSSAPASYLSVGSNIATSTVAWTGSPTYKQTLSVVLPNRLAGAVVWRVRLAKASTTVYVDPKPSLTNV